MNYVVVPVHGTWARKAAWMESPSRFRTDLKDLLGEVSGRPFRWSGRNSAGARARAAEELQKHRCRRTRLGCYRNASRRVDLHSICAPASLSRGRHNTFLYVQDYMHIEWDESKNISILFLGSRPSGSSGIGDRDFQIPGGTIDDDPHKTTSA